MNGLAPGVTESPHAPGNILGAYIRRRREDLGMTQTDLAARIGISQGSVSDLERGRVDYPKAPIRRALAEALGVSHLDLLIAANELTAEEASVRRTEVLEHPGSLLRDWLDLGHSMTPDQLMNAILVTRGLLQQARRYPGLSLNWTPVPETEPEPAR